jgi:hypothetical protein
MTAEEQKRTGMSRLSPAEKEAFQRWLSKLLYFAISAAQAKAAARYNVYYFPLDKEPPLLSEKLAIEKARIVLTNEGYDAKLWQLTRADDPPSEAPDGTPDKFFYHFKRPQGGSANQGRVHFTDGKEFRRVQVSLENGWIVCRLVFGP